MAKQTLYKVMKLTTDKIYRSITRENFTDECGEKKKRIKEPIEFNLKNISYNEGVKNKEIVDIGDNLLFYKIREHNGNTHSPDEIYDEIQDKKNKIKEYKKLPSSPENKKYIKQLECDINNALYVTDIINVKVNNIDHYKLIALNGFSINGKKYKRFCCGSGQMRRNTVTFINEELYDKMTELLMCGLYNKEEGYRIDNIILAKLSAYFALSFSSVLWVRTPRICVIPDTTTVLKNQKIDFIKKNTDGSKDVEERIMDIEMNSCDGEGLIDPTMATLFSEDMGIGYDACQFVVRTAFVKGLLLTFDFRKYFKDVLGITKIKSIYNEEFNIDEIDVLLTESMFKMHSYYKSVKEYVNFHNISGLKWGVTRYNKKRDDDYSLLNYQYIQNNGLNEDGMNELLNPTVDWFKKICSGDDFYSVMYSIGSQDNDAKIDDIISNCGSLHTKAIAKNITMLSDGYVKKKIYDSIKESFRQAKIGRCWCRGGYQFMISDPIPLLQNAAGVEVKGEISANHIYSTYWNKTNPTKIDLCRSPMVDRHEHNVLELYNSEITNEWYKYLYSGIIYSIYDTSTIRHSDSDFDGDIVYSTDNLQLILGSFSQNNPIIYNKEKAPAKPITYENIVECDLNGFDTLVGQITNNSTSMNAMLPLFPKDKYPEQHSELLKRLKLLREIIGAEIDKIKLGVSPEFPKEWVEREKINDNDPDEVKAEKHKRNSMVICKKPYFMIYLYNNLYNSYRNHIKQFDYDCRNKFKMSLNDLRYHKEANKEKRKEQIHFIKRVDYFSPILDTPCIMNKLCHKFEDIERDISYNKSFNLSILPSFQKRDIELNDDILHKLEGLYREYKARRKFSYIKELMSDTLQKKEFAEYLISITKALISEYRAKCNDEISSNTHELFEYFMELASRLYAKNEQFDFSVVWDICDEDILDVIPAENQLYYTETENKDEGIEYLGKYYRKVEVTNDNLG
jgi:hypothetical protein